MQGLPASSSSIPPNAGPHSFSAALGRPTAGHAAGRCRQQRLTGLPHPTRASLHPPSLSSRFTAASVLGGRRSGPRPSSGSLRGVPSSGNSPVQGENVRGPEGGGRWAPPPPQPCAAHIISAAPAAPAASSGPHLPCEHLMTPKCGHGCSLSPRLLGGPRPHKSS